MSIGDKIKFHRNQLGLTQTQLGERLGVQKNAVSKWERGRVEDIPTSKLRAMAQLFEVPVSYLIDDASTAASDKVGEKKNIVRIAGRDGRYIEREMSDQQIDLLLAMVDQMPKPDDL